MVTFNYDQVTLQVFTQEYQNSNIYKETQLFIRDNEFYIEGRRDRKYYVRITNNTNTRLEAVISIDGYSIIDHSLASIHQRGYIIPSYSSEEFRGWRTSKHDISPFMFGRHDEAYSVEDKGSVGLEGTIGIALFQEYQQPNLQPILLNNNTVLTRGAYYSNNNVPLASCTSYTTLGTKFIDEREVNPVEYTAFTRSSSKPYRFYVIHYKTRQELIDMGFLVSNKTKLSVFPGDTNNQIHYCKPPNASVNTEYDC